MTELLLHELNHRINNEFTTAICAVSAAAARSGDQSVKAALAGVTELLHRFADVHRALQMPELDTLVDATAYLRRLCLSISRSELDHREIKLVLLVQPLRLRADRCWRLGLIVHELVANAARHAFEGGSGEIRVAAWRDGAFVKCSVEDNGSAPANIRPGRGLRIVKGLSNALRGRFGQTFSPRGSRSLLVFRYDGAPTRVAGTSQKGIVQGPERTEENSLAITVQN